MFAERYFGVRYFATRYFPKVGAAVAAVARTLRHPYSMIMNGF